jgi:hypothetical protein
VVFSRVGGQGRGIPTFADETSFSGLHSDQLKLTEWFTRIDPR